MSLLQRAALPYAGYYGAVFLAMGVYLPFWPLWLGGRGLGAGEIGLVLGAASLARILGMPLVGRLADRSGQPERVMLLAALVSAGLFALFPLTSGFWSILLLHLVWVVPFAALTPLGESEVMRAVRQRGIDYGRVRLWGSLAFILGSTAAGLLLGSTAAGLPSGQAGSGLIWPLLLGALLLSLLAAASLPRLEAPAKHGPDGKALAPQRVATLLADRAFLLFLLAGSLLQASHGAYYGFSALHWKAEGLSETLIGLLWAEGVIAEIILFLLGGALTLRLGPARLLLIAGLAGIVRWPLMAWSSDPLLLAGGQLLHAFTFGATHLALVTFIAQRAPQGLGATAQSLYSAVSGGLALGAALWLAGRLYESQGEMAFLAMTLFSSAGLLAAFTLRMVNLRAADS